MKKLLNRMIITGLCIWFLPYSASAAKLLVPVGQVVGLELGDQSVTVAAFDDALGSDTRKAGLQIGDEILEINGKEVGTPEDVRSILEKTDGSVEIHVERHGKEKTLTVNPRITSDGPRLGVYLRRGVTGIGTVTWYNPDTGEFGTLGHGVNDASGKMLQMVDGKLYPASVISVKAGKPGSPGQLRGAIRGDAIGTLSSNTVQGVFGKTDVPWSGEPLPVATYKELHTGAATICATVSANTVREYSVDILKIYPESRTDGRNLLLKVTDPALLAATGGIVQGMSGSPIIQDGKLVGAVTHVLVNDPTTGYGIFIENMLDAAS